MEFAHYLFIFTIAALVILRVHGVFSRFGIIDMGLRQMITGRLVGGGYRIFMEIVVSLTVLASALYIILSGNFDEGSQKWAFGAVGSIIGYWLKPVP